MNNKSSEITIVYIEDSDDVRFACEQTLTLAGYRVISCCDAELKYSPYSKSGQHYYTDRCQVTWNIRTRAPQLHQRNG